MRTLALAALAVSLTACATSYQPTVANGSDSLQYKADVSECQGAAGRNYFVPIVTPFFFFAAWNFTPEEIRQNRVNCCMVSRGYAIDTSSAQCIRIAEPERNLLLKSETAGGLPPPRP